ncbi:MAG: LamG domain-containing protein, partial [Bacteroidetes bacterium]|nr:LamG domain-containing protein [Bacteroidota bacterium]
MMIKIKALVIILTMALISKAVAVPQTTVRAGNDPIILENSRVALNIRSNDGAIRSMYDKSLDIYYEFEGLAFEILTNKGALKGLVPEDVQRSPERITLNFETPDFLIDLVYSLGAKNGFAEKWIEIKEKNNEGYFVKDVILENTSLDKQFKEIHFHDDNTIWQCPINLFLRGERGGCFAGLEYPYWKLDVNEHKGFSLGFSPNYQVAEGEIFVSEKYFLGTFRREGIHRYSQGPYPGEVPTPYLGFAGGLH